MIQKAKNVRMINTHRVIATFFLLIFVPTVFPINNLFASNNGPNAPEAASFEPVDASDMVSLATGDMAYVLPILNVPSPEGGYPLALAYHGGVGYDQEASWVGLGWNLNPGSINRNINGYPDDWKDAKVRDREYFSMWSKSVTLGVGYQRMNASLGYAWDSNGTKKGSVGIGIKFGGENGSANIGIGASYSNKTGWAGNVNAGYKNSGFGVGVYANTDGLIGVSAGHSGAVGNNSASSAFSSVGVSLSSNKGSVGIGLTGGGNNLLNTSSGTSDFSSFSAEAGFYLYGFYVSLAYAESTLTREKTEENHVFGPLYFSELSNNVPGYDPNISYPNHIQNEHFRNYYMDTYNQPIPEVPNNYVSYTSVFDGQKFSYNTPSYDTYEVNAQGLSGQMSPRLVENGLLINAGVNIQYEENQLGQGCAGNLCNDPIYSPVCCNLMAGMGCAEQWGEQISEKRILVNSNYNTDSSHKFDNTFGGVNSNGQPSASKLNFYFDYQFPSDLVINSLAQSTSSSPDNLSDFFVEDFAVIPNRKENSDFIEVYTNEQIGNLTSAGKFLEAKDYNRTLDPGYRADGIGGYKITTTDGKTYHYSRPVYHFEEIYRQLQQKDNATAYSEYDSSTQGEQSFYREVRKTEPYATHWLLTAITGPDYVKNSANPFPSDDDYGYWVRFDYGNWTDGYTWRTPFSGYNDASANSTIIRKEYSWGRKQLVYLDKVVTRTHTALFVKALRDDDIGKNIGDGAYNVYPSNEDDDAVDYPSQRSLRLDQIILLKNSEYNNSVQANSQISNLTTQSNTSLPIQWVTMDPFSYSMNQQSRIIDVNDLQIDQNSGKPLIYNNAEKIIKLTQEYKLAIGSPNSLATSSVGNGGRLTLKAVEVLSKGGESYIPPYSFEYIGETGGTDYINHTAPGFNSATSPVDDWGYHKDTPELWTLNKITTPTGASIEFDYEEDEFYTEAFSRRVFNEENLKFRLYIDPQENVPVLQFAKSTFWGEPIDFTTYFDASDPAWGALYCCHAEADDWSQGDTDWFMMNGQIPLTIKSVTANDIIFYVPAADGVNVATETFGQVTDTQFRESGGEFCFIGNDCQENDNNTSYVFNFKVLANRVPAADGGGGIRVSRISSVNELGERLSTDYDYQHPTKNRTSGITSYAPSKGKKYVAYQSEVPGPRVIYEYVTLTERSRNDKIGAKTRYQFNVLTPVLNIFNTNMQSGNAFKSTVSVNTLASQTYGVDVKLEDNFATIGSLLKVSEINKAGQVLREVRNTYLTLNELADSSTEKPGKIQESFHSMKSVYDYEKKYLKGNANIGFSTWDEMCDISENIVLRKMIATSASKITYPLVSSKRETIQNGQKITTEFKNIDPKTGMFLESYTTLSDGRAIKTESVPAYIKYGGMGSKVDNINNKHMLQQEAMTITSITHATNNWQWSTLNASINTWNNVWTYRDNLGGEVTPNNSTQIVWRKHKMYAWKGATNLDGTYTTIISPGTSLFDWTTNMPISPNWKKTSEITRYTHYSNPIEVTDINGNFMSNKMVDKSSKVSVSGNCRFTELYYTGAEHVDGNPLWYEGEIKGANFRSTSVAHTGDYSMWVEEVGDEVVHISGTSGPAVYNANDYVEDFRPGKYKISVWGLRKGDPHLHTDLRVNNLPIALAEVINAGCWAQLNYYFDIPPQASNVITLSTSAINGFNYYDDFRMSPISSNISSFVYNNADKLIAELDSRNIGTAYIYDASDRLQATYIETPDITTSSGGFKIISQNKQRYIGQQYEDDPMEMKISNCIITQESENPRMDAQISTECIANFNSVFKTEVSGGSGNYYYQYKWLKDEASQTFTEYSNGQQTAHIPYTPVYCDSIHFNKKWDFTAKITDAQTNQSIERSYRYLTAGCNYVAQDIKMSDVQISSCDSLCGSEKYSFVVHTRDISRAGNIKLEFAYYNPNVPFSDQTLSYVDVTSSGGFFCPDYLMVADANCPTGYRKAVYFTYRTTNLLTGRVSHSDPNVFFSECTVEDEDLLISLTDTRYIQEGYLVIKDHRGTIINAIDVNRILR